MKIVFLLVAIFASPVLYGYECTKQDALKAGLKKVKEMHPRLEEEYAPFSIDTFEDNWIVSGYTPKGMRGGGAPTVVIEKNKCRVIKFYYAR